jgi:hypothetical protein
VADQDPLRRIFDGLVEEPLPTHGQIATAREALLAEIERGSTVVPSRRRRVLAVAVAAALVLAIVFTTVVPWNQAPASALLAELAEATRNIAPQDLPPGSYVYVESEQLVSADAAAPVGDEWVYVDLLIPSHIEAWWQGDTVRLETTVGRPVFFDQEMEDFYYAHELDAADSVGETRVDVLAGIANEANPAAWSTDPDQLAAQMREAADADPAELPFEVKMLEVADELLAPQLLASPALRAALLDVLATLDIDDQALSDGRILASVTYQRHGFGTVTSDWIFDGSGYLVERRSTTIDGDESGVWPAGTVFDSLAQSPPTLVAEAGVRPTD